MGLDISSNQIKRGVIEIAFYLVLTGMAIFLGTFAGFVLSGFESNFFSNLIEVSTYLGSSTIYQPMLLLGIVVGLIFPIINLIFIKKDEYPVTQKGIGWIRFLSVSYLFNPEQSFLWYLFKKEKNPRAIKWSTNILRVLLISIIVFLLYGMFQSFFPQLSIVGVPPTLQQITPTSDIIFGSVIPTFAEGAILFFPFFLLLGLEALIIYGLFYKRGIIKRDTAILLFFLIAMFIIAPLVSLGWMEYHGIVYANSEASQVGTFLFALISTELTILFGIFFWFYAFHLINNLVLKLLETNSGDLVRVYLGIALFVFIIAYTAFEIYQRKKKRRFLTD